MLALRHLCVLAFLCCYESVVGLCPDCAPGIYNRSAIEKQIKALMPGPEVIQVLHDPVEKRLRSGELFVIAQTVMGKPGPGQIMHQCNFTVIFPKPPAKVYIGRDDCIFAGASPP